MLDLAIKAECPFFSRSTMASNKPEASKKSLAIVVDFHRNTHRKIEARLAGTAYSSLILIHYILILLP